MLLLSMEHFCDEGALDLHCALGAEFLTAEATDTGVAVDYRPAVLYYYSFRGADVLTDTATYAEVFFQDGFGAEDHACGFGKESFI